MSCDAIAAAALLWLTSSSSATPTAEIPPAVAQEPLFASIITKARALKVDVDGFRTANTPLPADFAGRIGELSQLDMQGHLELKARGVDGDLKCILRGISQDLPLRLDELQKAADAKARDRALREMAYLLNDNVEVITAPPKPPV
ncbi:MAG: hypothetical protein ABW042_03695 [Phenylobacterium sp.]